jgi:chemotaxis protein methyltransferase CheR
MTQSTTISDDELDSLTRAIRTRYGLDLGNYEKVSLKRGFVRLLAKHELKSTLDLWRKIMAEKDFLREYLDDLMVNLTEFFRNPEAWVELRMNILPELERQPGQLDIWHAGCSSGEEVYTMAIVLHEMGLLRRSNQLATDLSGSILELAQVGTYTKMVMARHAKSFDRFFTRWDLGRWFDATEETVTFKRELRRGITFRQHDLVREKMDRKFDIIFCRNVMMYFDDALKARLLQSFHDSLKDHSFLVVGYYDVLPRFSPLFEVADAKTRMFRKVVLPERTQRMAGAA